MNRRDQWEKKFRKSNRRKKRYNGRNFHHLTPRSRGGKDTDDNLLLIEIEKHEAWHKMFGIKTAKEVLALLERVVRAKESQRLASESLDTWRRNRRAA